MKERVILFTDQAFNDLRHKEHQSRRDGKTGIALLFGTTDGTTSTVPLVITDADPAWELQEKLAHAKAYGLVQVGQSQLILESLHNHPQRPSHEAHPENLITPPDGYVFLLRHKVGPRSRMNGVTVIGDHLGIVTVRLVPTDDDENVPF
jgi:hypothetical protein